MSCRKNDQKLLTVCRSCCCCLGQQLTTRCGVSSSSNDTNDDDDGDGDGGSTSTWSRMIRFDTSTKTATAASIRNDSDDDYYEYDNGNDEYHIIKLASKKILHHIISSFSLIMKADHLQELCCKQPTAKMCEHREKKRDIRCLLACPWLFLGAYIIIRKSYGYLEQFAVNKVPKMPHFAATRGIFLVQSEPCQRSCKNRTPRPRLAEQEYGVLSTSSGPE